jgi:hypothetical protein
LSLFQPIIPFWRCILFQRPEGIHYGALVMICTTVFLPPGRNLQMDWLLPILSQDF